MFDNDFSSFYKKNDIKTANSSYLILVLYNEALKNLDIVIDLMQGKDVEEIKSDHNVLKSIHDKLVHTHNIIMELIMALDFKNSQEISEKYHAIYIYIIKLIIESNLKKDINKVIEVKKHITELKSSWELLIKMTQEKKDKPQSQKKEIDFSL